MKRKWKSVAGAMVLSGVLAPIAHAEYVLSTRTPYVKAGQDLELTLLITNPDADALSIELPAELHVRMDTGPSAAIIVFVPETSGPLAISPGGFREVTLRGTVPLTSAGTATLTTTGFASNPLLIVSDSSPAVADVAAAPSSATEVASKTELVNKPPALGISVYEPVYLLIGGIGGLNAKFQISLRYRMFDDNGAIARRVPWLDDLYFSYSQTSLMSLDHLSKPFRDSSYRPRLFYANYDLLRVADGRIRLGMEGGVGHESNGKDGLDSRSLNILYAKPTLTFGDPEGRRFYIAPMIYHYFERDENQAIVDYRGNVDLLVGFGRKSGFDVWGTFRKGKISNYGSVELNVSYPLSALSGGDLSGWLLAQYFTGYGESLLDFNRKLDAQVRIGLAVAL